VSNKIELINLGLSQIRVDPIESLTEQSAAAIHVNRIYDTVRDFVLADIDPKWARKQEALAVLSDEEVSGYDFVYSYPADCAKDIEIYNPAKVNESDTLEYDLGISSTGNNPVILTNYEDAELIYVMKVTNTGVYDPFFIEALAMKIAAFSALPLTGDERLAIQMAQAYMGASNAAKAFTRNRGYKIPDASNSFTDARD
jgi:hypothetical protein